MAMAVAQAYVDHDLAAFDDILETTTESIKRGIRWLAQLHLFAQFDHAVRTSTLVNVQRGWEGMTAKESLKQFK